jgi:rhomboid protease GluP
MSLLDDILKLFGTNRVQLRWRLQRMREKANRKPVTPADTRPTAAFAPRRKRSVFADLVTMVFLAACIALYIVTLKASHDYFDDYAGGSKPANLQLIRYGANISTFVFYLGEYWRLVTANFLHASVVHIGFNAYAIYTAGGLLEDRWGKARTAVVLLVTGVAGHALSAYLKARNGEVGLSVGASAAAFGQIGFVVGHTLRFRDTTRELRAQFIPWLIFGLIMTFASTRIDVWAHVGGLGAGLVLGFVTVDRRHARKLVPQAVWNGLALVSLAVVAWAFVMCIRWVLPAELQ